MARNLRESHIEYYHSVEDFADYLVGLISYQPLRILFLSKFELPTHPNDPNRILSPFAIQWDKHPGLNAFHRIGITRLKETSANYFAMKRRELLPASAGRLGLTTDVILNTILSRSNFRIWDMSLRGFAKEMAFTDLLGRFRVAYLEPQNKHRSDGRADKSDLVLLLPPNNKLQFLQIKGLSVT